MEGLVASIKDTQQELCFAFPLESTGGCKTWEGERPMEKELPPVVSQPEKFLLLLAEGTRGFPLCFV